MTKLKPSIKTKINAIEAHLNMLSKKYDSLVNFFIKSYDIDLDKDDLADNENYYEYREWQGQAFANMVAQAEKLNAERAALMLIGYNIARRGKPLHESQIIKKTAKLSHVDREFILYQMRQSTGATPVLTTGPHLHRALKRHGITLLDTNAFMMIMNRLDRLNAYENVRRRKIDKYEKQLKKFRRGIEAKLAQTKQEQIYF